MLLSVSWLQLGLCTWLTKLRWVHYSLLVMERCACPLDWTLRIGSVHSDLLAKY